MNDYKEMRKGKILLNRFPYNKCKDFRRQSQHEKENHYFLTNDDGFFVKMYEAVGNPEVDEVEITRYYPDSDKKEVRRIVSQKDSDGFEENLPFSTLDECLEHADAYLTLNNLTTKELSVNITKAPEQNQELVTETITNNEGKKITRNTLKNKETTQEKVAQSSSQTHSHSVSKPQKQNTSTSSNNSNTSTQTQPVNQSFVANMSISRQTTQAITVVGNGGNYATLTVHTKRNGVWTETLRCSARVGKNGITGNKREGDGKTPRGIYSLGQAFGLAGNPGTSRSWLQVNNNHYWVDDVNSSYYNKLVDASQTGIQWNSAEHLISYPTAYRYAIAVNYNTACTRGAGSAIFLHCSTGRATAGCISVSQNDMVRILKMLQGDTLIGIYQNKNSLY